MKLFLKHIDKPLFLLILITTIGAFLRFYKLDWGNGIFTHPDEYHIIASVNQLFFPNQMHPHFFSYGTFTIYLIYLIKQILLYLGYHIQDINIFLIGRFCSAIFSTLTIIIIYKISRFFMNQRFSLVSSLLAALTPGLIQQAHFTTPESNLIFFMLGTILFIMYFLEYKKLYFIFTSSIFLGFSLGVKISSIVLLAPLTLSILIYSFQHKLKPNYSNIIQKKRAIIYSEIIHKLIIILRILIIRISKFIALIVGNICIILITFAIIAPFVFIDFQGFINNLQYEGGLAIDSIPVFYTRQFIHTLPIIFQLNKIFPYALGFPLLFLGIEGLFLSLVRINDKRYLILIISFISIFIPNVFLFTKWTRFISPIFPFFSIFSCLFIEFIFRKNKKISILLLIILITTTIIWSYAFFSIYLRPDVRIVASSWLEKNLPNNSTIMIEGGNMIDIPLSGNFNRSSYDFYNFDYDKLTRMNIYKGLENSDYFIVQSRRVFLNHQRSRVYFPKTAHFYDLLFSKKLGFEEIKEFNSYPMLSFNNFKIEFPDENAEETWSVFDHPVIRIFKKINHIQKEGFAKKFNE